MTKKTWEAVKATAAIVITLILIFILLIYPLNQAGKIVSRPAPPAAPLGSDILGVPADTLDFTSEDNLKLKGLFARPQNPRGTFILIHGLSGDCSTQIDKAKSLLDSGYAVLIYDQRGYGCSEGKFVSGGYFETDDFQSVIAKLELSDRLIKPVIVWGEDHGASAALRAWEHEPKVDYIIAENPVAGGRDWQKRTVSLKGMSAPEFSFGLIWWWMKIKSGYEIPLKETNLAGPLTFAKDKHPGKLLIFACGSGGNPSNKYLVDIKNVGGDWRLLPCGSDQPLFGDNKVAMVSDVFQLLR